MNIYIYINHKLKTNLANYEAPLCNLYLPQGLLFLRFGCQRFRRAHWGCHGCNRRRRKVGIAGPRAMQGGINYQKSQKK